MPIGVELSQPICSLIAEDTCPGKKWISPDVYRNPLTSSSNLIFPAWLSRETNKQKPIDKAKHKLIILELEVKASFITSLRMWKPWKKSISRDRGGDKTSHLCRTTWVCPQPAHNSKEVTWSVWMPFIFFSLFFHLFSFT